MSTRHVRSNLHRDHDCQHGSYGNLYGGYSGLQVHIQGTRLLEGEDYTVT